MLTINNYLKRSKYASKNIDYHIGFKTIAIYYIQEIHFIFDEIGGLSNRIEKSHSM